ncbi:jg24616 [Pararge aegeria aegeria]|uniref:Jg24616 protein n=1 Tax=Pararge aegeria aegeria TaxID=348720 RepID=A0A8S4SP75_9NEOP|nr:jg24616 [Pararge aegeria aegeria]
MFFQFYINDIDKLLRVGVFGLEQQHGHLELITFWRASVPSSYQPLRLPIHRSGARQRSRETDYCEAQLRTVSGSLKNSGDFVQSYWFLFLRFSAPLPRSAPVD